jgi:hypothetical protein
MPGLSKSVAKLLKQRSYELVRSVKHGPQCSLADGVVGRCIPHPHGRYSRVGEEQEMYSKPIIRIRPDTELV